MNELEIIIFIDFKVRKYDKKKNYLYVNRTNIKEHKINTLYITVILITKPIFVQGKKKTTTLTYIIILHGGKKGNSNLRTFHSYRKRVY